MNNGSGNVSCGSCRTVLDERSDTPVDQRTPCPACGSTARAVSVAVGESAPASDFVSVSMTGASRSCGTLSVAGRGQVSMRGASLSSGSLSATVSNGTDRVAAPHAVYTVVRTDPTEPGGSYNFMLYEGDDLLVVAETPTFIEGVRAVYGAMRPPA